MVLPEYLSDVAKEMRAKSAAIRRDFSSHRLSAGENREHLVAKFLTDHLPRKFGVSGGMVFSHDGMFSKQADLVIVDEQDNAPLYPSSRHKLWPVEAVYALIEVKTTLSPADLTDAVGKCRRFKSLHRSYCKMPRISDSLFLIWGFDSPSTATFKANLLTALEGVPRSEQPDLILVPDQIVALAGAYLELSVIGRPNSTHRAQLRAQHGPDLEALIAEAASVFELGENSLLAWYVWLDSWLRQAGSRLTDPVSYLLPDQIFGHMV